MGYSWSMSTSMQKSNFFSPGKKLLYYSGGNFLSSGEKRLFHEPRRGGAPLWKSRNTLPYKYFCLPCRLTRARSRAFTGKFILETCAVLFYASNAKPQQRSITRTRTRVETSLLKAMCIASFAFNETTKVYKKKKQDTLTCMKNQDVTSAKLLYCPLNRWW